MVKTTGSGSYLRRIRQGGPEIVKRVGAVVFAAADAVAVDAQISLTTGATSGANHTPSAPGTPPNQDSGTLGNSIQALRLPPLRAQVIADAPYAAIQEYGGIINHPGGTAYFIGEDGMATFVGNDDPRAASLPRTKAHEIVLPARPYLRPALEKNRDQINSDITKAVNSAMKAMKNGAG